MEFITITLISIGLALDALAGETITMLLKVSTIGALLPCSAWNKANRKSLTPATISCTLKSLRWGVAAQLFGMGSRQDGNKFPGCLKENARPSLSIGVGLFVLASS